MLGGGLRRRRTARRVLRLLVVALVLTLGVGVAGAQGAKSYPVTGLITNEEGTALGLAGTQVEFLVSTTHALAEVATVELDGRFAASLPEGTYEVIISPPLGSSYPQYTNKSFVVGEARSLEVTFVHKRPSLVKWSGVLLGNGSTPLAGYKIRSRSRHLGEQTVTTGEHGEFTIGLGEEADDELTVVGERPASVAADVVPSYVSFSTLVSISEGSRQQNLVLPLHILDVKASGPHGGVAGAQVGYEASYNSASSTGTLGGGTELVDLRAYENSTATNAEGVARIAVPATVPSVRAYVTAAAGAGLEPAEFETPISNRSGELHREVQLHPGPSPVPIVIWSGVLEGKNGYPLAGYTIRAYSPRVGPSSATTDPEGHFSLEVGEEANDELTVEGTRPGSAPSWAVPSTVRYRARVSMASGPREQNLVLPLCDLTVSVRGPEGPVEGAALTYDTSYSPGTPGATLGGESELLEVSDTEQKAATGTEGTAKIAVPVAAPPIQVNVTPPGESHLESASFEIADLTKDETREILLGNAPLVHIARWESTLVGAHGEPLAGYIIRSRSPHVGEFTASTGEHGEFTIELGEEAEDELTIEGDRPASAAPGEAPESLLATLRVSMLGGNRPDSLKLPFHVLSVKVIGRETTVTGAQVEYARRYEADARRKLPPARNCSPWKRPKTRSQVRTVSPRSPFPPSRRPWTSK